MARRTFRAVTGSLKLLTALKSKIDTSDWPSPLLSSPAPEALFQQFRASADFGALLEPPNVLSQMGTLHVETLLLGEPGDAVDEL